MLVVTGIFEIAAESIDDAKVHAEKMAVATREEAGCHAYAFYEDIETPGRFRIYEEWDDEGALLEHMKTPHMADFQRALGTLKVKSAEIVKFQAGEKTPIG